MKETEFVVSVFDKLLEGKGFTSTSDLKATDVETSRNVTLTRTIKDGISTIVIVSNTFNATVPDDTGFATPQLFVDGVLEAIEDEDNDLAVEDGVLVNNRVEA